MLRRILSLLLLSVVLVIVFASAGGCGKTTDVKVQKSDEINTEETVSAPHMVVQ